MIRVIKAADKWEKSRAKVALHDATSADYRKFERACEELGRAIRAWRKT